MPPNPVTADQLLDLLPLHASRPGPTSCRPASLSTCRHGPPPHSQHMHLQTLATCPCSYTPQSNCSEQNCCRQSPLRCLDLCKCTCDVMPTVVISSTLMLISPWTTEVTEASPGPQQHTLAHSNPTTMSYICIHLLGNTTSTPSTLSALRSH